MQQAPPLDGQLTLGALSLGLASMLELAMLVVWGRAWLALEFGRWLPVLKRLAPLVLASAIAAVMTAATDGRVLLSTALLIAPVLFYAIQLISRQPASSTLGPGERMHPFKALDGNGELFSTHALSGRRTLLKFYRGHWCPYCRLELRAWHQMEAELERRNIDFIAISPDTPAEVASFAAAHKHYRMRFLSDENLVVTDRYNLRKPATLALALKRGPLRPLAIPTTLAIDESGLVRWVDQSTDHQVRSNPARVLPALDKAFTESVQLKTAAS